MVATTTPARLRDDAIVEAVFQINFIADELSELVLGRLSDFEGPNDFRKSRLPIADVPSPIRKSDPQLAHQPLLELKGNSGRWSSRFMRIGDISLSWHVTGVGKYPGWSHFKPELEGVVEHLFKKLPSVKVRGLTLRYINALVPARHSVKGVHDLKLQVVVAGEQFAGAMNLNLSEKVGQHHRVVSRVADATFVMGELPKGAVAVVDVEVSAVEGEKLTSKDEVCAWLEDAHTVEKEAFFRLMPQSMLNELSEG